MVLSLSFYSMTFALTLPIDELDCNFNFGEAGIRQSTALKFIDWALLSDT